MPHPVKHLDNKQKTSAVSQYGHVTSDSRINGKLVAMKKNHSYRICSQKEITVDVMTPTPNENILVGGGSGQIKYFLETDTAYNVKNKVLRFQINLANSANLPPVSKWWSRLEIYQRSTNQEMCRIYGDILHMLLNRSDKNVVANYNELVNQSDSYGNRVGEAGNENTKAGTHYYYLPLNYSLFENSDINFHNIVHDLEIRLHVNSNLMSQYAANGLKLLEVASVMEVEHPDQMSANAYNQLTNRHVMSHTYIDTQQYFETLTMNANTRVEIDLDQFDEKSSMLVVYVRPTGVESVESVNFENSTVDVIGVSGESEYGSGRSVVGGYLRDFVVGRQYGNQFFNKTNILLLPFCNQIHSALSGVTHSYFDFTGSKRRLQINTGPAGTQAQYDFVFTADTSTLTGNVQFSYDGSLSLSLPVGSTDGVFTTALNNLLANHGLNASYVSDSVTNKHVEFTDLVGGTVKVDNKFDVVFTSSVAGQAITSKNFSDNGSVGWTSGTYDCTIYSISQRNLLLDRGKLSAVDI
jgi:hypothetical protein